MNEYVTPENSDQSSNFFWTGPDADLCSPRSLLHSCGNKPYICFIQALFEKKNRCNLIHATLRELRLKSGRKLYSFQRQEDKDQKGKSTLNGTHLLWGSIQRGMRAGSGRDGR